MTDQYMHLRHFLNNKSVRICAKKKDTESYRSQDMTWQSEPELLRKSMWAEE